MNINQATCGILYKPAIQSLLLLMLFSIILEKVGMANSTMTDQLSKDEFLQNEKFRALCLRNGIKLAILFGSRVHGAKGPESDWDLAFWINEDVHTMTRKNLAGFRKKLVRELCFLLQTSQIDLVILNRASPFLKYRVAKNGKPLYEEKQGVFASFVSLAVRGYSDSFIFREAGKKYLGMGSLNG